MTDTSTSISCVVIGGGQAGLSASYYLKQRDIDHVVLEKHRIAHAWRDQRWDSFCLVTPNWQCRLPDFPYAGPDPHGFMLKDEIVDYVEAFADSFAPPVIEGVTVTRVSRRYDGRFVIETSAGQWIADEVVIATGDYDTPIIPPYAANLDPSIQQIQTTDYRNPEQMPDGATLVIGTGQSGVQLMEDLRIAGREVHLAVGPAPRSPRMYRGRDATDWLFDMGHYDLTVDNHPLGIEARAKTNHYMTGRDGGHEIDLRQFACDGVQLYGSLAGFGGTTAQFLPDLETNLDDADASYCNIRATIDAYIEQHGIDAPEDPAFEKVWRPQREVTQIDLAERGITSVLWCIGFRPDYTWIDLDVFDSQGRPVFHRGVCDVPGVYFLGLGWLNTWGSGRFLGVAEDARFLVDCISARHSQGERLVS
ncbi:MSMEG_0569 family flavin-dependent oxidoreductase [Gymnodinialimonas sp. 2305UL16-5]|uniref:MSMEG_0569 family flavin-dependent oxidoreductase n=1 Tax=Gymnodinialimonas mytili TaxID=3126503 RepID=UPI0030A39356